MGDQKSFSFLCFLTLKKFFIFFSRKKYDGTTKKDFLKLSSFFKE